jgi:hypothetical protein
MGRIAGRFARVEPADDASRIRAMQVVTPAGVDISGLGVEVQVGAMEGLPLKACCGSRSRARALPPARG